MSFYFRMSLPPAVHPPLSWRRESCLPYGMLAYNSHKGRFTLKTTQAAIHAAACILENGILQLHGITKRDSKPNHPSEGSSCSQLLESDMFNWLL